MQRTIRAAITAALLLGACTATQAQQKIEWKQTINTPKGLNVPRNVKLDVLGLESGDSHDEVKAKLEKLLAEVPKAAPAAPRSDADRAAAEMSGEAQQRSALRSTNTVMRFPAPGGTVEASYVGKLSLNRQMPSPSGSTYGDLIEVRFSAPSSGHQLLGLHRSVKYTSQQDQPRISEIMNMLSQKIGAQPIAYPLPTSVKYVYQFDNGRAVTSSTTGNSTCPTDYGANQAQLLHTINAKGDCDVILLINIGRGISADHASWIDFTLSDNERTKINLTADFGFFESYVRDLQSRTRGAAPKL